MLGRALQWFKTRCCVLNLSCVMVSAFAMLILCYITTVSHSMDDGIPIMNISDISGQWALLDGKILLNK